MRTIRSFIAVAALALVAACTTVATLTPHEQEASALTVATAARLGAQKLLKAHSISPDEAQAVNNQADAVVALVQAARALPAGSSGLPGTLTQIGTLLQNLQPYVESGVPK